MYKKKKLKILTFLAIGIIVIFILRLGQLQIFQGDYYRELSLKNKVRIVKIPAPRGIIYDRNGIKLVKNVPYYIVSILPEVNEKEINIHKLSKLLGISDEEIKKKLQKKYFKEQKIKKFKPIRLKEGLSFNEVVKIEAKKSDFPGLIIETEITRYYPFGDTAAHILGYIGKPTKQQLKKKEFKELPDGMMVGQWGVEKMYDKQLRGIAGVKFIEVDALGRELRTLKIIPPKKGESIYLSIDILTQIVAEKSFNGASGALMAIDPNTAEVITLVSLPSFNPNIFIRGITQKQWLKLIKHPGHPLINRVFQSQYPPGSIFKIITAIAALEEEAINTKFHVNCKGAVKIGNRKFRCWKKEGHGIVSLKRAIIESCDVYFYEVGRIIGIDTIAKYAYALGLGNPIDMGLAPEKKGLIPTTSWKWRTMGSPWYLGETFNAAIGQGYVSLTPAQAAIFIAAIANGGKVYKPTLLKGGHSELINKIVLKPNTLKVIKEALYGVVNQPKGTGWKARSENILISGKTGTAQVVRLIENHYKSKIKDHAWFVAYAPSINPKIALSVIVEHGESGGKVAAPIAKAVIQQYLLKKDYGSIEKYKRKI